MDPVVSYLFLTLEKLIKGETVNQRWNMYLPKPVQIPIDKFMEKNFEGKPCWYEVTKGQCIQGLLAQEQNEYRLYIVTVDPEDLMNCHYRWPHIITCSIKSVCK
jgi:hypothetical protein